LTNTTKKHNIEHSIINGRRQKGLANHRSAIKRHRQSEARRLRNSSVKTSIRTAVKKVRENVKEGKEEDARLSLAKTVSLLDGAVSKGVLHRRNASRKISRLTVAVNSIASK
jgi:small subunit ribosomal protein S20